MAYWVLFESATGRLHCRGDTEEPTRFPGRFEAKSFASKPLDTEEWDESTRDWVAMTVTPPVDFIALAMADIRSDPLMATVTLGQRQKIEDVLVARLGRVRFDG